jgi:hypothetical protein
VIGRARADLQILTPPAPMALEQAATILSVLGSEDFEGDLLEKARNHVQLLLVMGVVDPSRRYLWRSVLWFLTPQGEA